MVVEVLIITVAVEVSVILEVLVIAVDSAITVALEIAAAVDGLGGNCSFVYFDG